MLHLRRLHLNDPAEHHVLTTGSKALTRNWILQHGPTTQGFFASGSRLVEAQVSTRLQVPTGIETFHCCRQHTTWLQFMEACTASTRAPITGSPLEPGEWNWNCKQAMSLSRDFTSFSSSLAEILQAQVKPSTSLQALSTSVSSHHRQDVTKPGVLVQNFRVLLNLLQEVV